MTDNRDTFWKRLEGINAGMLGAEPDWRLVPMSHYAEPETATLWFITAAGTDRSPAVPPVRTATGQAATWQIRTTTNSPIRPVVSGIAGEGPGPEREAGGATAAVAVMALSMPDRAGPLSAGLPTAVRPSCGGATAPGMIGTAPPNPGTTGRTGR